MAPNLRLADNATTENNAKTGVMENSPAQQPRRASLSGIRQPTPSQSIKEEETPVIDGESSQDEEEAQSVPRRRKRDVVRQISLRLYLKGKDIAGDVLRNVRGEGVEEEETTLSRTTRRPLWMPKTQDDSVLIRGTPMETLTARAQEKDHHDVDAFFSSRVTDPTSYFYRFHFDDYRHLTPQKAEVQLVDINWLKPHEQIVSAERVSGLKKATINWDAYTEPLLVDIKSGAILDGHHRYNVGLQLRLKQLPAVLVDYLGDDTITVDVWPECGRTKLTKEEVIKMSLSPNVFPPKTSRHRFTESLPPISIPLSVLRQNPTPINDLTLSIPMNPKKATNEAADDNETSKLNRVRDVSINLISTAQTLATTVTKSLFRNRLRKIDNTNRETTQLDMIKRPPMDSSDFFTAIRENDPTSSFCRQKAATFEDLLSSDASRRKSFYLTRIWDPTSYFYKYNFDAQPERHPKKIAVKLVSIKWLKAHEQVVSWERVDGLRRATVKWDAYLEPLLVDVVSGAILDGHHRYHVGKQLGLECVPCVLVDYLGDDTITVDVWPNCGRDSLTKQEVIDMSLSNDVFPPKTSRHTFSDDLPPISVPLARLRVAIAENYADL
ncbi:hypothetical protein Poli38472_012941 [Pythium oligandrum]|uniref:ParB-like N-terminal domain-containing protein n=1 Tax=Pythium oligandrum TaxID=41045 RepID=A0A8K1FKL5_PYTOL|nr:hypothetical protein Poli38472_012941 [Pythium oligandrum]|eukprot:TMW64319.1 hypothetical protein Poli38472_012941 [Pythium oligandrum]